MKKFEDFKLEKGDVVKFTYPEGYWGEGIDFKGTFDKYVVVDEKGMVKSFGPRNIKKAKSIFAYINVPTSLGKHYIDATWITNI